MSNCTKCGEPIYYPGGCDCTRKAKQDKLFGVSNPEDYGVHETPQDKQIAALQTALNAEKAEVEILDHAKIGSYEIWRQNGTIQLFHKSGIILQGLDTYPTFREAIDAAKALLSPTPETVGEEPEAECPLEFMDRMREGFEEMITPTLSAEQVMEIANHVWNEYGLPNSALDDLRSRLTATQVIREYLESVGADSILSHEAQCGFSIDDLERRLKGGGDDG